MRAISCNYRRRRLHGMSSRSQQFKSLLKFNRKSLLELLVFTDDRPTLGYIIAYMVLTGRSEEWLILHDN